MLQAMKKRFALLLAVVMVLSLASPAALAADLTDTMTWDLTDGVLTISGTGAMPDYSTSSSVPWSSQCTEITSVVISNGITSIGSYAFYGCSNLTGITLPDGVTTIGSYAFYSCTNLTSVTIPDSVTSIGSSAFNRCTRLTGVTIPNGVTAIGNQVFYNCTSLTSVAIPDGVTTIGTQAFYKCTSLLSITLPAGLTNIGNSAFYGCTGLTSVEIPASVTTISSSVFYGCTGLTSVEIPASVTTIGTSAFYRCTGLTNVEIPASVTTIGGGAFSGCTGLTGVAIPDGVTTIGNYAFSGCTSLTGVTIPAGVTAIGDYTFSGCTSLTGVVIPDSVKTIGNYAFSGCTSLTGVTIPESVETIGNYAFQKCTSLPEVTVPDSVTTLGEGTFYSCESMTEATIGSGVTTIAYLTFGSAAKLDQVEIPESVTQIGYRAFDECTQLEDVYYGGSETEWEAIDVDELNECLTSATIHYNSTAPVEHSWGDWTVTKEATCTEAGQETRICADCGATETRDIPPNGHTEVIDPAVPPTCTETGLTQGKHCSVCGEIITAQEVIPALGHDYVAEVTAPTCTEQGYTTYTCSRCGDSYVGDYTEALGHDYVAVVTAPTCTEQGYTTYTCSRCGDSYVDDYVDALGHDWGEWIVDQEATGTEDGSQHRNCSRCDAVDTQIISMLEKQEVGWTIPDTITWTYGQVSSVQNTAYNDTEDGGALTYSSRDESVATVDASGKAAIVGAGTVTITATAAAVPGKYAATSASYTLVINKAPLTVTANDAAITYGQVPAGNGWTASVFAYDDDERDVTGTASYAYTYEQYGKVGTYAINVSGLSAKNYDITFVPGTLTVSKATDYTITLGNLNQRDDGVTDVTAAIVPQDSTARITVEYLVGDNWTAAVPTAAGEYRVRASLTASDNIQADGAYTYDTLTIQRSIVVDDTDVSVSVDGSKAELIVTEDELADIVDNADGDVSVNLSGVESVDELVLPGSLLEALSESGKADSLTITTEDASISMSSGVLDTVANAVTGGEDKVSVKLTAVEEENLNELQQAALNSITQDAVIVEVSLVITHANGTETELHQLGGNVEVTVPFDGELPADKYIVVCYLSDDGNVTYVRATYNAETKQVTFTTNHFSNYAVFVSGNPAVVVDGGSGSGLYAEGAAVTIKADSKSGYTFAGWEVVSGGVTLTDSKAAETTFVMPAANVELRATYTKITSGGGFGGGGAASAYTLTFDTNGGSKIDSVTGPGGTAIDLTGYVPTREGYDFDGWYSDAELTDKVTSVELTRNMTVYAKWTEKGGENPFTDVADDTYYAEAVIWAIGEGITSGTTATTFSPDADCTRAQAVTFLWRAAGSPAPKNTEMPFTDVAADAYYRDAVLWAVEQGITKGTGDTTFSPDATCARAQIVTFLWRSAGCPAPKSTANPFTDVAADAYYADAVLWAAENGITGGTSATTFSPNVTCTRAQIVTFLFRCLGGE